MRKSSKDEFTLKTSDREDFYDKMSSEQHSMFDSIQENIFTFCEATAGSGKTITAIASMVDLLDRGIIDKIVYIQKPSERYLSNGFLPGTMDDKTNLLFLPFYDSMHKLGFFDSTIEAGMNNGSFRLVTDSTLRGINLERAGLVIDESQNIDYRTLKLIYTRCDDKCHVCTIGDIKQKDNKGTNRDFIEYGDYLSSKKFGNKVYLTTNFRGAFSKAAEEFSTK